MDIVLDGVAHEKVQVIVRDNMATVRKRGAELIARKDHVIAVQRPDRKTWLVQFADGVAWEVKRNADCGCR